jgi:predicted PurR-regulated permease PerM
VSDLRLASPSRPVLFWGAAFLIGAVAVALLRDILLPFVAALALAYLLDPLVERLARLGVNRAAAALGMILLFFLAVGSLVAYAVPIIGSEVVAFIGKLPDYAAQITALANDPSRPWLKTLVGEGLAEAEKSIGELASFGAGWSATLLGSLWSEGQALISVFSLLIVTPIVTYYLVTDWKEIVATLDRVVPAAHRETVRKLAREIDATISGFIRGQGTICLALALYYAIALWVIGLDHAILIGATAGLVSFIPYLGSLTGIVLSICVAILQFWPNWGMIPVVAAIFVVGQLIADYVLAPTLIGSKIKLDPVWMMFSIAAFGALFGFVGLLIAVPAGAAIGVLVRYAMAQYFLAEEGSAAQGSGSGMAGPSE